MAYTVKLLGVDKTSLLKAGTLRVIKRADNRNECSLSFTTTAADMGTTDGAIVGQDIKVYDGTTLIFGGIIKTVEMRKLEAGYGNTKKIQLDITSDGYSGIPARRTPILSYNNQTAGYIVENVRTNVLNVAGASENISAGTISAGITLTEYDASGKNVKEIFDELASACGFKWYIDDSKALNFISENTVTNAPHDIVEGGAFTDFKIEKVSISLDNYRNKQYVFGGIGDDGNTVKVTLPDNSEILARQTAEGGSDYSSGVYGDITIEPNIETLDDGGIVAANALKKYGTIPYSLEFTSFTNDWVAGSKLKVNLPTFGIASDSYYLIEEIAIEDIDGKNLRSAITATRRKASDFSTQKSDTYKEYFSNIIRFAKEKGKSVNIAKADTIYMKYAANAAAITVATDTSICSIINTFAYRSKAILHFSAMVETTASVTTKAYLDTSQQAFIDIQASDGTYANVDLTIPISPIEAGEHTILIKMTGSGSIAISQAQLSLIIFTNPQPSTLADTTGFTATAISNSEIDLAWTNPADDYFTEVEAYRSTTDISGYTQAECASGATKIYNGTGTSYADTGLTSATIYYYKIFAKYSVEGATYYSDGVSASEATNSASVYQEWASYPDSPDLTADFNYQCIGTNGTTTYLIEAKSVMFIKTADTNYLTALSDGAKRYTLTGGVWVFQQSFLSNTRLINKSAYPIVEANNDIYIDSTLTTVYKAKTTP